MKTKKLLERITDAVEAQVEARVKRVLAEPYEGIIGDRVLYTVAVDRVTVDVDLDLKFI